MDNNSVQNTRQFTFEMPINKEGLFCGNLTVEGFASNENGKPDADIDRIDYEGIDIKPVLELLGGMSQVDAAAANHAQSMFEEKMVA